MLGYGPDSPPRKLFFQKKFPKIKDDFQPIQEAEPTYFSWRLVVYFLLWASAFASFLLFLCGISVKNYGGLWEMIQR